MNYLCPRCAKPMRPMKEPHRWMCFRCQKVWTIVDVIAEAALVYHHPIPPDP